MADEFVEAAARAISILGEGALGSSAAELVRLALDLVGSDGVVRNNLKAAADALSQADSAGRAQAVVDLLNASTALEGTLGVGLDSLRSQASELARACRAHLEAAEDTEKVRLAAAGLEQEQWEERPAGPWWWLLLRGRGRVQRHREDSLRTALLAQEDPPPPHQVTDGKDRTVEMLREELKKSARENLLPLTRSIEQLADDLGVPHALLPGLLEADTLEGADSASAVVAELGTAATELELLATARLHALRAPVAQLSDACRKHQQAAMVMEAVQRAAEERAQQRGNAAGTAVQNERLPAPGPIQGNELSSECSAMQGTALLGALTMLPYMGGKDGLVNPDVYSRKSVGVAFAWLWCILGTGVTCLMGRSPLLHMIARLLSRLGMLVVTLLVVFYCQWSLAPDWTEGVWALVAFAVTVHVLLFVLACYHRDL
ncbi:unnamed protein product [Urochloa humidicola]